MNRAHPFVGLTAAESRPEWPMRGCSEHGASDA